MLDNETMRKVIRSAIEGSGLTHAAIAAQLGVTEQAITGWLRTGRIDKRRLPALARITCVPLAYFMPDAPPPSQVRSDDPLPYGGDLPGPTMVDLPGPETPAAVLWNAYMRASAATQRAVDLLLLEPTERSEAISAQRGLVASVELLELCAEEALSYRKSA